MGQFSKNKDALPTYLHSGRIVNGLCIIILPLVCVSKHLQPFPIFPCEITCIRWPDLPYKTRELMPPRAEALPVMNRALRVDVPCTFIAERCLHTIKHIYYAKLVSTSWFSTAIWDGWWTRNNASLSCFSAADNYSASSPRSWCERLWNKWVLYDFTFAGAHENTSPMFHTDLFSFILMC